MLCKIQWTPPAVVSEISLLSDLNATWHCTDQGTITVSTKGCKTLRYIWSGGESPHGLDLLGNNHKFSWCGAFVEIPKVNLSLGSLELGKQFQPALNREKETHLLPLWDIWYLVYNNFAKKHALSPNNSSHCTTKWFRVSHPSKTVESAKIRWAHY